MQIRRVASIIVMAILLSLTLAACGGSDAPPEPAPAPASAQPAAPAAETAVTPPAAADAGLVNTYQDVKRAIVQIEAQGSFVDPEYGLQLNAAGRGSGFIIDPSGIAVTNNHVVTGAAFLRVWVGGETQPRNAKILGVSECSDLAVIDIDGDDFPYLDWYPGAADVGLEIYVAGFPLGDPEFTLTRGIISKRQAGGETPWSSVDHVLEYDATTNPGNSGGAVVDANGRVVAVHYAGRDDTRQAFGIGADVARDVVSQMRAGRDVHSIGVNGSAVNDGAGLTGIWVSSVKSGSPADRAGIRGGDIITRLEGLVLATDGAMSDYCDILRSRNPEDVLSIEVLRFSTQEVLEGQLNGRELAQSFSFAQQVAEPVSGADAGGSPSATYQSYVGIYDDAGSVYMEVPAEWADVSGDAWTDDGDVLGASLQASTNLRGFYDSYTVPGIAMFASTQLAASAMGDLLDLFDFTGSCAYDGRSPYSDPVFKGSYDLYTDCDNTGNVLIVLAAEPEDRSYAVILIGQAATSADLDAIDHVLDTFNVVGTLPG
jgi:serine protease Do